MPLAAVLGRDPNLSLAELTALAEPAGVSIGTLSDTVVVLDTDDFTPFAAAGGSTRLVALQGTASSAEAAINQLVGTLENTPKLKFGLTVFGKSDTTRLTYAAKEALEQRGIKARFIPSKGELNSAQIKHNGLLKASGAEWVLLQTGDGWHYGRTVWIPDFEGFAARDFKKPVADAKRGMLPPQMARIMVNLATKGEPVALSDPFCGIGNLLMESAVTNHPTYGSDLEPPAIEGARQNLEWVAKRRPDTMPPYKVVVHDATQPLPLPEPMPIATEGYLGTLVRKSTTDAALHDQASEVDGTMAAFLKQAARRQQPGQRTVITFPAWKLRSGGILRLPLVDRIADFGYTIVRVTGVSSRGSLDISRPNQTVIHELFILERT